VTQMRIHFLIKGLSKAWICRGKLVAICNHN